MYIDRKDSPPNGYQSGNSHCSKNSYTYNALGSVIALTDETGAIKTQYIYDPYGNVTTSGEASDNPFQYTGRENDGTGLYYYRARYYSSELQRFISEDPIGFKGGINFFAYVGNDPVNWVDPWGLIGLVKSPYYSKSKCPISPLYTYAHAQRVWGQNQFRDDSPMRHCVVSCMVASKFGAASARVAGIGNEIQGFVRWDLPDLRGRLSGSRAWAFQWKDLQDNERGIRAAQKNCRNMSDSDMQQSCIKQCQGQ